MSSITPEDLERAVDRALRALPLPKAPATLLPRVMATVRSSRHARTWFAWPLAWQAVSLAAAVLLIAAIAWLAPAGFALGAASLTRIANTAPVAELIAAVRDASQTVTAFGVIWRGLLQPLVNWALVFVVVMCVACMAFGTALSRIALGGATQ
jgi:hypothetical protein